MGYVTMSTLFKASVHGSHVATAKIDAYYSGSLIQSGLDAVDGSVTVDSGQAVRRTFTSTLADQAQFPGVGVYNSPFAPYGTRHYVYRGVVYPQGVTEWCPLGVFRIDRVSSPVEPGLITVNGADLSQAVVDSRFLAPTTSVTTNTVPTEIARLIRGSSLGGSQAVRDLTGSGASTPAVTWDRDRWQAIQELALTIGAEVIFGPDGTAIIRPVPQVTDPIQWAVNVTDIVITGTRTLDRAEVYNIVVATGERTDNVAPVRAVSQDTNSSSATYVSGPYGSVPVFYSSPLLTTTSAAQKAADTILARVRGLSRQVTFECVPDPSIEAGDVMRLNYPDGSTEVHLVDTLQIPLHPSGTMRVTTRTSNEPGLS